MFYEMNRNAEREPDSKLAVTAVTFPFSHCFMKNHYRTPS